MFRKARQGANGIGLEATAVQLLNNAKYQCLDVQSVDKLSTSSTFLSIVPTVLRHVMDNAYHLTTKQVISGTEASYLCRRGDPSFQNPDDFVCPQCKVAVKLINMKVEIGEGMMPHVFSTRWTEPHKSGCDQALIERLKTILQESPTKHQPGGPLFVMGLRRRRVERQSIVSVDIAEEDRQPVRESDKLTRQAHHRLEDLLWLPSKQYREITAQPNAMIRITLDEDSASQDYPARDILRPAEALIAEDSVGRGVVYGQARFWRDRKDRNLLLVAFTQRDPKGRLIKVRLRESVFRDSSDERLLEGLALVDALDPTAKVFVALPWSGHFVPLPEKFTRLSEPQVWLYGCHYPVIKREDR